MKNTILFIILSIFSSFGLHKYYVSLAQIELNPENNRLEIAIKYFTDDVITAVQESSLKKIDLGNGVEDINTQNLLKSYFEKKISLKVNGDKAIKLNFLGYEDDINDTWVYIESEIIPEDIKSIFFSNNSLFHSVEGQKHMIHFSFKAFKSSDILTKGSTTAEFIIPISEN